MLPVIRVAAMREGATMANDPSPAGAELPEANLWDRLRRHAIEEPVLGFRLDVSRMPFTEEQLDRCAGLALQALADMRVLESGGIANPDEHRRVGHYWLRSYDLAPDPGIRAAIRRAREEIHDFVKKVHTGEIHPPAAGAGAAPGRFRQLLLIGIGGSALGPQLVYDALAGPDCPMPTWIMDNCDPAGIDRILAELSHGLAQTLVVIVSKSGATKETRNGMIEMRHALEQRGLPFGPQCVAITQEGSALEALAIETGFLRVFPMWDWVGGRTSVMSAVGLLPAALQGLDIEAFLEGARRMDELTRRDDPRANPAAMLAIMWYLAGNGRGERDMVILPYKDSLLLLSRYLQQLVMESLGKAYDVDGHEVHQGLVVYGNKGSTDQHAFVQQLREGPDSFFVTFVEVLRDRIGHSVEVEPGTTSGDYLLGFLLGTQAALAEAGRGSIMITIPEVTEMSLGALIALFERAVGLYASLIRVNAYHQPGVEAGKQAAGRILGLQTRLLALLRELDIEAHTASEIAERLEAPQETATIYRLLEHLAANGRVKVIRTGLSWTSRYALR
jgi:glucose-6-phosphate isomerase